MSATELQEECFVLKSQIAAIKDALESKNQQIYEHKKTISIAPALEADYIQEIEILEANKHGTNRTSQNEIKRLEESISNLRNTHNAELVRKSEMITKLKKDIQERKRVVSKKDTFDQPEVIRAKKRIVELNNEIGYLNDNLLDSQKSIENLLNENNQMQEEIDVLKKELASKNDYLNEVSQEYTKVQVLIQLCQDEIVETKLELDPLKSKPLDPSQKGNSMFAEVEDSRMKLQQKLQQIKKMCSTLQQDSANKLKSMKLICTKNLELCKFLDEVEECNNFQTEIDTILGRIAAVESTLMEYKNSLCKEAAFNIDDLPSCVAAFGNNTINELCKNAIEAGNDLDSISKNTIQLILQIQAAIRQMIEDKRKHLKLKVEISNLECDQLEKQVQRNVNALGVEINGKPFPLEWQHKAINQEFIAFRKHHSNNAPDNKLN